MTPRRLCLRDGRWCELGSFSVALIVTLLVALTDEAKPFYYDAGVYWALADTFVRDGSFSLMNFGSPLRGYSFPLINHGLRSISGLLALKDSTVVKVPMAMLFAAISTVLLPRFGRVLWPQLCFGWVPRLALVAALLTFWEGYLDFPLSDFPALAAALVALVAVSRSAAAPWALVAGLAAAFAVNARPAYVLLVPALVVLFLIQWALDRRGGDVPSGRRVFSLGLIVVGLGVVSLPQSLAMHKYHGTWSPIPGSSADLSSFQLSVGLRLQRYETYVGDELPRPQLEYLDKSTRDVVAELPEGIVDGYGAYLGLAAEHPLIIAGVSVRHVVNGMDQRYSTPYVEHLDTGGQRPLRLAGFTLLFLALLRLGWPAARRSLGPARWRYAVALLLTSATSIPSAMETRFMLPVYALGFLLVVAPGWPRPWATTGRRRWESAAAIVAAYSVFMVVMWTIVSGATRQLSLG